MSTSTQTSQQNSAPPSPNTNQEIDSGAIITNAVPVSMVSPTSIKKKRTKRSKKKSTDVTEDIDVTPPPSVRNQRKRRARNQRLKRPRLLTPSKVSILILLVINLQNLRRQVMKTTVILLKPWRCLTKLLLRRIQKTNFTP
jgi:hypothetical protein